ncbi:MAG: hypothetical protein AAF413_04500, partial [Patescibacteria group bacterium]
VSFPVVCFAINSYAYSITLAPDATSTSYTRRCSLIRRRSLPDIEIKKIGRAHPALDDFCIVFVLEPVRPMLVLNYRWPMGSVNPSSTLPFTF